MLILPAIDLIDGGCVRLLHGDFDAVTRYGDPIAQLAAYQHAGAKWAHVVDLDGARAGEPRQLELIAAMARSADIKLQCGGGVRERTHVEALLEAGAARVVVGSVAARSPALVAQWIATFGSERMCCAFDVRPTGDGFAVAVNGWREGAGIDLHEALARFAGSALRHILVTDITRDGALNGPNTPLIASLCTAYPSLSVQASGGVSALADLDALEPTGAGGVIIGRALYEGRFTLEDALAR